MLDILTKSKIRQKIILLFIYNPEKSYYINEIARLAKTSSGTAQRELNKLVKEGFLIKKDKSKKQVYYSLNKANPLLSEIKIIVDKTIGIEHLLQEELKKEKNIAFAFLFGSYVKDDFNFDSDIDLFVIGDIKDKELYDKIRKVEDKINRQIDYHLSTLKEFKENLTKNFFYKDVVKKCDLIIGDENEFRRITQ
ncbi:MAG TPA: nucleotidyltransferase domain-containing protein [Candidatus Paceibacterota bacterium]|nr:nucleotidyltransferase domain-containing protein [Caldisericia bacterium]HON22118.1 nucleotidyltransferase domain-containing protein [Candidatus Paceibacterota bacterium]HPC37641.1 nucleotidyltransferase domain-containing protein [Candidatus Paceibacterota bacterium]